MSINEKNLIWLDMEMTGLNPEKDRIIEIATLITDNNLNILSEGPNLAIYQSTEQLQLMDKWNKNTHSSSGLINRVKDSKINEKIAEEETLNFISKWVPPKTSPICGNNIAQDRRFLFRYMPKLESYFHYRYLDVSTIKELVRRWKPEILTGLRKKNNHKALDDVLQAVKELNYYKENFIKF